MPIRKLFGLIFLLCFLTQTDAFSQNPDSVAIKPASPRPQVSDNPGPLKDSARLAIEAMPRQAAVRSAILPGLGQIHNGRWWKVPLVYGGFVGIGLVYEFNQRYYKLFLKEAQFRQDKPNEVDNPIFEGWTTEGIIAIKDDYRRNRDLTILAGLGFYAIQIIDAYIDAKFFRFDVSDELSLQIQPTVQQGSFANNPMPGIKLKISL